jgi:hypothetical protein
VRLRSEVPEGGDPTVDLYLFFVERGLTEAEAEVRTAKIGIHFWGWSIDVIPESRGPDRQKGCDAVRKKVERWFESLFRQGQSRSQTS